MFFLQDLKVLLRNDSHGCFMHKFLLFIVPIILVSCGNNAANSEGQVASLKSGTSQPEAENSETSRQTNQEISFEDAQLNMAACMRSQYPSWPDPDPSVPSGYNPQELTGLGIDLQGSEFREVVDSCQAKELQGFVGQRQGLSLEEQAEQEEGILDLFACVREVPGFEELPDPNFSSNGLAAMRRIFADGSFDLTEFQIEAQRCIESGQGSLAGGAQR